MKIEIVDGVAWRIIPAKRAGKTPARLERREVWSRDPFTIQQLIAICGVAEESPPSRRSATRTASQTPALPRAVRRQTSEKPPTMNRPIPDWPAVLHAKWAAAYLSLSTSTFREQIAPQVPPIQLTAKRIGWLRSDLDDWIATRKGSDAFFRRKDRNAW